MRISMLLFPFILLLVTPTAGFIVEIGIQSRAWCDETVGRARGPARGMGEIQGALSHVCPMCVPWVFRLPPVSFLPTKLFKIICNFPLDLFHFWIQFAFQCMQKPLPHKKSRGRR